MKHSDRPIRTRFAPSPTGFLHIGGIRTALFSWLFAKQQNGTFILRIEDTDIQRSTQESVEAILRGLGWLQIDWDEGPYYQSQRMDRYHQAIQKLLDEGHAYRCYCSQERLLELRNMQLQTKKKPRYDGFCRNTAPNKINDPFVIRFRNPIEGKIVFNDLIHGTIAVENSELDDLIILRTDGTSTYNLAAVVDDWDMEITHVIRGDDHINNTPRQINILHALGAELPQYAHVPMILGTDGKRLSKRHGAVNVLQYREQGYLPEALINYLVRLGWSHGEQEIFSRDEMIQWFDIQAVSPSTATFDHKKLLWLNQYYLKTLNPVLIVDAFTEQLKMAGINYLHGPALEEVIVVQAKRTKTLKEMAECSRYFFENIIHHSETTAQKQLQPEITSLLQKVRDGLATLSHWEKKLIYQVVLKTAETTQVKLSKLTQSIRIAITGNTVSPPIDATLYLIGRDSVLDRLDRAIHFIK
ncbi:glutamate--tRNA ligase [Coxiella endosymbiont of Amblyomma nuttalli]|uniref:glutamate--tRNA ligase n=1 Tax=Coxiella endosymbiont of Amblyomma nuttalli TaxID=2749996 RepID=UPI001BA7B9D8|nr:glutamate--tRNA ligase [Coxiella endosymbiont of Amblyomma nuttalli]QTS83774.1 Glutamate--tRNA ligase [Coxiella endosymbiont of Amblyomma nuttalli]